jgi:hypothetical protein
MWFKGIKKRGKANGLKRERLKISNPSETSSFSFLMIT